MAHFPPARRRIGIAPKAIGTGAAEGSFPQADHSGLLERLDAHAVAAARHPLKVLAALLAINLALLPVFVGAGLALGDQALLLREGAPGTVLSFALLLAVAVAARAVYLRDGASFWRLSAAVFLVFAIDEITQAGMFLSEWLGSEFSVAPASGFNDLDSLLLVLLFSACGLLLASRAAVLFRYPRTLALLCVGVVMGAASQALDSFVTPTDWEFVAEESLKLAAEPFFIAAFLTALATVRARRGEAGTALAEGS
ncbi:MAG TPA: hypothetical protein VGV10_06315 [Thermoleophilaceae bacterium]|nr:hypothetical protein [Thermoleophilaceae bacterium]